MQHKSETHELKLVCSSPVPAHENTVDGFWKKKKQTAPLHEIMVAFPLTGLSLVN